MSNIQENFVRAYFQSGSSRRKRSTPALTCSDLNQLTGSLNSIPDANLNTLTAAEFRECIDVLGYSTNSWSNSQTQILANIAKSVISFFFHFNFSVLLILFFSSNCFVIMLLRFLIVILPLWTQFCMVSHQLIWHSYP